MEFFSAEDVSRLLSVQACIPLMEQALADLAQGEAEQPLRTMMLFGERKIFGQMPGWLKREGVVGTKIITVVPENRDRGISSHQGVIVLFSADQGIPLAVVDADSVTAVRTAAVSGVATQALAAPDARVLAILGTGTQARTHLQAMLSVGRFSRVLIWGPHRERAEACQTEMAGQTDVPVTVADSAAEAVREADVICTVTSSQTPILFHGQVKSGAHINAVGSSRAVDRELDGQLVAQARLYVDRRESAEREAGDFLMARDEGLVGHRHIVGELGDVLLGRIAGRSSDGEITLFKSLGLAVEDVACAHYVYERRMAGGDSASH